MYSSSDDCLFRLTSIQVHQRKSNARRTIAFFVRRV